MIKGKAGNGPKEKHESGKEYREENTRKIPLYKSYFGRMIFIVLACFLMVISISFLYLYAGVKNSLKKRTDTEKLQTYSQLAQNIDTFRNEMELLALRTVNNTATTNMVVNTEGTLSWNIERRVDFFSLVNAVFVEYSYVQSVCFYSAQEEILFADSKWNIVQEDAKEPGRFFEENLRELSGPVSGQVRWYGGYNSEDFGVETVNGESPVEYISLCKPVFRGAYRGWLVINIDLHYFTSLYNNVREIRESKENAYLIDQNGFIISSRDPDCLGENRKEYVRTLREGYITLEEEGKQILCYPISVSGWTMVNEMPMSQILGDIGDIRQIFIAAVAAAVLLSALLIVIWLRWMVRPLLEVVDGLQKMENGQLGVTLDGKQNREDEIGLLVNRFNQMSVEIKHLVEENARMEEKKREAQIQILKAQINPHFLYNTLNTVKWMALVKGETDMADCVSALGDLISPVFKDGRDKWTLEEEQEYITNYGKIMNYRYGEQTSIEFAIPLELSDILVPKFVLQPIVENAFLYGRKDEKEKLKIKISAEERIERIPQLLLTVTNDGPGLKEEELRKLRQSLESEESKEERRHIGLKNIYQRLKLLYGEDFSMKIQSEAEKRGFLVALSIPASRETW